jgi:hypothetical protein
MFLLSLDIYFVIFLIFYFKINLRTCYGSMVKRQPLISEAYFLSQANPCWICGEKNWHWDRPYLRTPDLPCHCYFTCTAYSCTWHRPSVILAIDSTEVFALQGCYAAWVVSRLPTSKMGEIGCSDTAGESYQRTLRSNSEERTPRLHHGASLKSDAITSIFMQHTSTLSTRLSRYLICVL